MTVTNTPSWALLRGRPTTVAGFGISDFNWATLQSKPTTVAGFGISDFAAQAIAAQGGTALGGVGAYCQGFPASGSISIGQTLAGSNIRGRAPSGNTISPNFSGTWRCMGSNSADEAHNSIFLRIA